MKALTKLALVPIGKDVTVKELRTNGSIRRRLLELGFTVGNTVTPLYSDGKRSITAYKIMNTVIALRREDAMEIITVISPEVSEADKL